MKQLTYSAMAAARLRANKRGYRSLVLGIFLSVFLISTLVLTVYGVYLAQLEQRREKVGLLDMVVLDGSGPDSEALADLGLFDRIGRAYVSGVVTGRNLSVGYYDETGLALLDLTPTEGRLPENAGEIALEASALEVLEVQWSLGDIVQLSITPVDGTEQTRSFTLVGILPERSVSLEREDYDGLGQFPAIVTHPQEPAFAVGRLGCHLVLGLDDRVTLSQALKVFWERFPQQMAGIYGLSVSGEQLQFYGTGNLLDADRDMFTTITMACILAGALVLSCAVGIAGAMEGMLSGRREEIGVLRALGATRRQIRRIFGRENLLLALTVAPASVVLSCAGVWLLSLLAPRQLTLGFHPGLLLPIGLFSGAVILLAGYLPLARASRQMPMGVIRDTAMLRRSMGLRTRIPFSPARLMTFRQLRFHPTRQIGASVLVALTLLCSGLLTAMLSQYQSYSLTDSPGFTIEGPRTISYQNHVRLFLHPSLDRRSLSQLSQLEHVRSLGIRRNLTATLVLEQVPRYALMDSLITYWNAGSLDDAMFQELVSYDPSIASYLSQEREQRRQEYLDFLDAYQISGQAYDISLLTLELNRENLDTLNGVLQSGKVDVDAVNAGRQVILCAPEIWILPDGQGGLQSWYSREAVDQDPNGEGAFLAAWNESFTPGQSLSLTQLYQTAEDGPVLREDTQVSIGAVVSQTQLHHNSGIHTSMYLITTEQGLENMGLYVDGMEHVSVYLDGALSREEEDRLERQITAISRRTEGYTVFNRVESLREREQAKRQALLLCFCVAMVFFAVAVGMILSSATRQLHSQSRTIGMLRAVGAEEKTLLGCYSGQVTAAVAGGVAMSLGAMALLAIGNLINLLTMSSRVTVSFRDVKLYLMVIQTILILGAVCQCLCRYLLRFRIRQFLRKSIIETIKEL